MIVYKSHLYQIERCDNTPIRFALDHRETMPDGHVCLNNLGWFACMAHATSAMNRHFLSTQQEREVTP
jgi:hypothetical protein